MSLVTIDAGKAVAAMAEAALAPNSPFDLYVRVEVRLYSNTHCLWQGKVCEREGAEAEANKIDSEWEGAPDEAPWPDDFVLSESVHFLIRRPRANRQVFACRNDSWSIPKPDEFVFFSEHDSCWREPIGECFDRTLYSLREKAESLGVPREGLNPPVTLWIETKRVESDIMRHHEVDYGPGRYSVAGILQVS